MNERIKQLAEQAKLWAMDNTNFPISSHIPSGYTEKFAELIITECMAQCTKVEEDDELCGVSDGALLCREEIKEHFGVEE